MKSIREYVREREMRQTGGHPENASYHSRNYRRHFEGWSEVATTDERGRKRVQRVYTGVIHRAKLEDKQIRLRRILYALDWLCAAASFFIGATRQSGSNSVWYVAACEAVSLAMLAWLMWSLFNVVTSKHDMTLGEFAYVKSVKRSSLYGAIALGLTAVTSLAYALAHPDGLKRCALFFLLGALCCLSIHLLESRTEYDSVLSREEPPQGSTQISL